MEPRLGKHYDVIRINNLKLILKLLRNKGTATKAELAELSGLSFPTAGSLLTELIQTGEVVSLQYDSSTGGRPAERFKINPLNTLLFTAYIEDKKISSRIYDSSNKIINEKVIFGNRDDCINNLLKLIDESLTQNPTIKFLSIGLPAAVFNGKAFYIPDYPAIQGIDLNKIIYEKTGLHTIVENDVNCMVKGYSVNQNENEYSDIVYIYLGPDGFGTGILNNGDILKGTSGFAGELGFIPIYDNENLCSVIRKGDRQLKIDAFVKIVTILSCVINTGKVIFGGVNIDNSFCSEIQKKCEKYIIKDRIPQCIYSENIEEDYYSGLLNTGFSYYHNKIELL